MAPVRPADQRAQADEEHPQPPEEDGGLQRVLERIERSPPMAVLDTHGDRDELRAGPWEPSHRGRPPRSPGVVPSPGPSDLPRRNLLGRILSPRRPIRPAGASLRSWCSGERPQGVRMAAIEPPDGWAVVDGKLHRELRFRDFSEAFGFMARVALAGGEGQPSPELVERVEHRGDRPGQPRRRRHHRPGRPAGRGHQRLPHSVGCTHRLDRPAPGTGGRRRGGGAGRGAARRQAWSPGPAGHRPLHRRRAVAPAGGRRAEVARPATASWSRARRPVPSVSSSSRSGAASTTPSTSAGPSPSRATASTGRLRRCASR